MVPYSAPTGVLLAEYLRHRAVLSRARGPASGHPPGGVCVSFVGD